MNTISEPISSTSLALGMCFWINLVRGYTGNLDRKPKWRFYISPKWNLTIIGWLTFHLPPMDWWWSHEWKCPRSPRPPRRQCCWGSRWRTPSCPRTPGPRCQTPEAASPAAAAVVGWAAAWQGSGNTQPRNVTSGGEMSQCKQVWHIEILWRFNAARCDTTHFPQLMMAILSPRRSASSMKWVVRIMVLPALYLIKRSQIALREYGSTPAVGSSNTTTLDVLRSAKCFPLIILN